MNLNRIDLFNNLIDQPNYKFKLFNSSVTHFK